MQYLGLGNWRLGGEESMGWFAPSSPISPASVLVEGLNRTLILRTSAALFYY